MTQEEKVLKFLKMKLESAVKFLQVQVDRRPNSHPLHLQFYREVLSFITSAVCQGCRCGIFSSVDMDGSVCRVELFHPIFGGTMGGEPKEKINMDNVWDASCNLLAVLTARQHTATLVVYGAALSPEYAPRVSFCAVVIDENEVNRRLANQKTGYLSKDHFSPVHVIRPGTHALVYEEYKVSNTDSETKSWKTVQMCAIVGFCTLCMPNGTYAWHVSIDKNGHCS